MPKAKKSSEETLKQWIRNKEDLYLLVPGDSSLLFCRACGYTFTCKKKNHFTQHDSLEKHKTNVKKPSRHRMLPEVGGTETFVEELCEAFVAADIPLFKIKNKTLASFLKKHTGNNIPSDTTLRKSVKNCYDKVMKLIREDIGNGDIWISVDETTDIKGRNIANMIVGKLSSENAGKPYLLACQILSRTNHAPMARFVNESLPILWPNGVKHNNVKLFVTDGAHYMLKCGTALKVFYKNMIHLTCFAHGLNLICEHIRNQYDDVNKFISNVKKFFQKAPLRVECYQEALPNLPLPPEPIITRWGTWIQAALFYADHFAEIKNVVMGFNKNAANCIAVTQDILEKKSKNLINDLQYIKANFQFLPSSIKKLETFGLPLTEAWEVIEKADIALSCVKGAVGESTYQKFLAVIAKNPGANIIQNFANLLKGNEVEEVYELGWAEFKFCPITSCDVERSFSTYKNILTDKRTNFTNQNLEMHVVLRCNSRFDFDDIDN